VRYATLGSGVERLRRNQMPELFTGRSSARPGWPRIRLNVSSCLSLSRWPLRLSHRRCNSEAIKPVEFVHAVDRNCRSLRVVPASQDRSVMALAKSQTTQFFFGSFPKSLVVKVAVLVRDNFGKNSETRDGFRVLAWITATVRKTVLIGIADHRASRRFFLQCLGR
jgi:hypothetical protein